MALQDIFCYSWLLSFNMMVWGLSMFLCVLVDCLLLFLPLSLDELLMYFVHSPFGRQPGHFQFGNSKNHAVMDIYEPSFVWT